MKIFNVRVYDLTESVIASGYPMSTEVKSIEDMTSEEFNDTLPNHFERARKLGKTPNGSGHDNFLKGILVSFDLEFSNKAWPELQRYNFIDFVSSCSTMHRISKFDLSKSYNEYVDPRCIAIMQELKDKYNETKDKNDYLKLLYSNPSGFELTARLTTNYLQLKTVYKQRHNHRLPEWRKFCEWMILNLPQFTNLTGIENDEID